jgi:hypothetical protein
MATGKRKKPLVKLKEQKNQPEPPTSGLVGESEDEKYKIWIYQGKHQSLFLAERNGKRLMQKHSADDFEILARRNGSGDDSAFGHYFTIGIRKRRIKKNKEYILHFDYKKGRKGKGETIDVQVHLRAPVNETDKEIKQAYREWWESGQLPKGYEIAFIAWNRRGQKKGKHQGEPEEVRKALSFVLSGRIKRIT